MSHKTGFVACPHCGHVNHLSDHHPHHSKKGHIRRGTHHVRHRIRFYHEFYRQRPLVLVIIALICSLGGVAYGQDQLLDAKPAAPLAEPTVQTLSHQSAPRSAKTPPPPAKRQSPPPVTVSRNETVTSYSPPPALPKICYQLAGPSQRATTDLTDDNQDYQVHVIYGVPNDGVDHHYDTNGAIARSVSAWQNWLCNQTSGRELKLDTTNGALDVTFVRLPEDNQTIETGSSLPWTVNPAYNPYVRDDIQIQLKKLGFNDPRKLYAVYYDGSSNYSCGGGGWPPAVTGQVAVEYMNGGNPRYPACQTNSLANDVRSPGYLDFDILHEIVHTLGFVPVCAPHLSQTSHVGDSPSDLMYSGTQAWSPTVLDFNHDDYYGTGQNSCPDLSNSIFLTGNGTQLPPGWPQA